MTAGRSTALLAALAFALLLPAPASAADPDYEALLADRVPAIVTIKYVVKYGADAESTGETRGVLVDPSGIVLGAGDEFGGEGMKVSDLKVMLGTDPTELEAVLVARDVVLDLAYLQILAPPDGKPLASIDLTKGADPKVGQSLFGVTRADRGFDFAPKLLRLYVTSRVETPRPMWNFSGDFTEAGLPAFDLEGRPVGVLASQRGSSGADESGSEVLLLPLKDVRRSLDQAKKRIPDAVAKAKEAKEAKEKDGKEPAMEGEPAMAGGGVPGVDPKKPPEPPSPSAPPAPDTPAPSR